MATLVQQQSALSYDYPGYPSSVNVDKVVQSVTNATKRLSQISTSTTNSNKKRKTQNKIGPWKLGRTLGRGSTGRVRLAKNVETGQLAAVKIVPKANFKKLENPKYKRASIANGTDRLPYGIEREIIIMKLINHKNIMGLYDVWENKNDLYLILEYIEGGELFDYLIKRGKLREEEAIQYFKQIINGINYLHQFNICHRDLKPENLLLDFNKNIKIADFGMAALEVREKLLETSCGSPHYASPEIVAGKNYHGAPSDIWSCGIILFALLTGHLPFDDENIRQLLLKVQSGQFIMPEYLSWEAQDLISQMLRVNPDDRITIDRIMTHPLLTKYPSTSGSAVPFDLKTVNLSPIESAEKIDQEILKNLIVLFHNCDEQTMISRLLSPAKCPEKTFYYLLMKYRNEHSPINNSSTTLDDGNDASSIQSIPKSGSIIKTTIVNDSTGKTHTTIKKAPKQASTAKNVLGNITNTSSTNSVKNFKASTSFSKKKTLMNNQVISRTTSFNSQRSGKKSVSPSASATGPNRAAMSVRPSQPPPKIKRKLTGYLDLDASAKEEELVGENKENEAPATISKSQVFTAKNKNKFGGTNKSLLNFGSIIDEAFNEDKLSGKSGLQSKRKLLKEKELALAARVHQINEERERKLQLQKEVEEVMKLEEERQSLILKQKQIEALEKLRENNKIKPTTQPNTQDRRFATEPRSVLAQKSSLDPRTSSLLRAKSVATRSSYSSLRLNSVTGQSNPQTVLKSLGIEVNMPKKLAPNLKSSGSRNLSSYLNLNEQLEDTKDISLNEYNKLESSIYEEEIENEPETGVNRNSSHATTYKSLVGTLIDTASITTQEAGKSVKSKTIDEDETLNRFDDTISTNNHEYDFMPNLRFSRFSMGGLLNANVGNADGDKIIQQSTLTSSNTVKRKSRNQLHEINETKTLPTVPGTGMLKKSPTSKLHGLGINMENKQQNTLDSEQFVSIDVSDDTFDISMCNFEEDDAISDDSEDTIIDSEYPLQHNHSVKTTNYLGTRKSMLLESDISNFDIISTRTAKVAKKNTTKPSIINLVGNSLEDLNNDNEANESIETMYKNYEGYVDKRSTNLIEVNKPDLRSEEDCKSSQEKNEANEAPVTSRNSPEINNDTTNVAYEKTQVAENGNSNLRPSRSSTGIFSTMLRQGTFNETKPIEPEENDFKITKEKHYENRISNISASSPKESVVRRFTLKPKRDAPKAPESSKKGHNRFSRISILSNSVGESSVAGKRNWFKKIIDSFTTQKSMGKNFVVINSQLTSIALIRVIKKQLQLKKMEGSISKVVMDEEFGLITGEIPAKFSHGRKLKFKMEIIDLMDSSSLHLHKIKGGEKGFQNFANVVSYIIEQEEAAQAKNLSK